MLPTDAWTKLLQGDSHIVRATHCRPSKDKSGSALLGRMGKHLESIPTGVKKEELSKRVRAKVREQERDGPTNSLSLS